MNTEALRYQNATEEELRQIPNHQLFLNLDNDSIESFYSLTWPETNDDISDEEWELRLQRAWDYFVDLISEGVLVAVEEGV